MAAYLILGGEPVKNVRIVSEGVEECMCDTLIRIKDILLMENSFFWNVVGSRLYLHLELSPDGLSLICV